MPVTRNWSGVCWHQLVDEPLHLAARGVDRAVRSEPCEPVIPALAGEEAVEEAVHLIARDLDAGADGLEVEPLGGGVLQGDTERLHLVAQSLCSCDLQCVLQVSQPDEPFGPLGKLSSGFHLLACECGRLLRVTT